ncbi:DUF2007 domain-containing protein [Aequorivita ciconiae]|nr:DUF2007 domain-containing protein [Aequorivita sp. H23M31]
MSDIKRIYTGPSLVAMGLVARLNEVGISPVKRDDHESAIRAGFAASIANQMMIFIRNDEMERAQPIIDEFFQDIGEEVSNQK